MIKLATVFSGIGAIEHALQRMNIDHEIVFACDNGDVDILSKKIDDNMPSIIKEIEELDNFIKELKNDESKNDEYIEKLCDDLNDVKISYKYLSDNIEISEHLFKIIVPLIESSLENDYLNSSTSKIYNKWLEGWEKYDSIDDNVANNTGHEGDNCRFHLRTK